MRCEVRYLGLKRYCDICCIKKALFLTSCCLVHFQACDRLLAHRVDTKMKGNKVNEVLNRLHLAMPTKRDNKVGYMFTILVYFSVLLK